MTDLKSQRLEGNLFKYTNVMRGFQQRYFVVNTIMAKLDYFMNEEAKSQRPRGSIELQNAIISPSEEDSTTFTINTPGNEIFKLRAQDAKERQHWVNVLRLVSQSVDENLKQTTTTNSTNGIHNSATTTAITTTTSTSAGTNANTPGTNGFHKSTSLSSGGDVATFNIIPPAMKKFSANNKELESSSFRVTNLELLKEVYNRVKSSNQKLEQLISTLPKKHSRISKYDKDILILKSTAQSCVNHISNCCTVLKNSRHLENETFGKSLKSSSNYNPTKNSTWSRKSTETSLLASPSSFHALTFNGTNKSSDIATPTRRFPSSSFGQEEQNASELTDPEEHDSITTNTNNNTATNNNNSQLDSSRLYEENREIVASTLQNLKTGADLTRINFPIFAIEKKSLLEMFADCFSYVNLFIRITEEKSAEDRMLAVIQWYLSLFHAITEGLMKKPYNPIVGEVFKCAWSLANVEPSVEVKFIAEQVSHHPTISAFYVECKPKQMKLNASILTKCKYLGTAAMEVQFLGELNLKLDSFNEEYIITFPMCHVRSILSKPSIELCHSSSIMCPQTGFKANLEFKPKTPGARVASNELRVEVRSNKDELIAIMDGKLDKYSCEFSNSVNSSSSWPVLFDLSLHRKWRKRVRELSQQESNESRRVWQHVTDALRRADLVSANNYKHQVEKQHQHNHHHNHQSKHHRNSSGGDTKLLTIGANCKHFVRVSKPVNKMAMPMMNASNDDEAACQFKWVFNGSSII